MLNFNNNNQDIGNIKANKKIKVIFTYEGDDKITDLSPTCSCSTAYWDRKNKEVHVTYSPSSVPVHMKDGYKTVKKVVVKTEDSVEILIFTAQVVN